MNRKRKKERRGESQRVSETRHEIDRFREEYLAGIITHLEVVSVKDREFDALHIFTIIKNGKTHVYPIRSTEVAKQLLVALEVIFYVDANTGFIEQGSDIGEAKYDN